MNRVALPLLCSFALSLSPAYSAESPAGKQAVVEAFSPTGTVKRVRQVTARFSEAMVPFGDPRLEGPFDIVCIAQGKGRWADSKNWVFDFEEDLPAGISCVFTLKTRLKTLSGKPIAGARQFAFSTGGPAIIESIPRQGGRIEEEQAFLLLLDAEAEEETIMQNVFFSVEGIKERIGVSLVAGEQRRALIESGPARRWVTLIDTVHGRATTLEFRRKKEAAGDRRIVAIQARQAFPPDKQVRLEWGAGVRTKTGVATTEKQILPFQSREPFTARFRCPRENPQAACNPLLPMSLNFSAPLPRRTAEQIVLEGPQGKRRKAVIPGPPPGSGDDPISHVEFTGPFPELSSFKVRLPGEIRDDSGRPLSNAGKFPLEVSTAAFPPLAKFAAPFGIIERSGEPLLPVTVRNIEPEIRTRMLESAKEEKGGGNFDGLIGRVRAVPTGGREEESIPDWLRKVTRAHSRPYEYDRSSKPRSNSLLAGEPGVKEFSLPKPGGAKAFEVIGIPLPKPGFYVVELESRILGTSLLGADRPMFVPAAALVTNLSAHFKWGRESSIVWVTTLDRAQPVPDAQVAIRDWTGKVLWQGTTDASGIARIADSLPPPQHVYDQSCNPLCGLFVTARKGDDLTFVFSNWDEGIEPYRFNLTGAWGGHDPTIAHTVFDRSLFRAGETVHMKHFVRRHATAGLFNVRDEKLPGSVLLVHEGSDQRYHLPLKWDLSGAAESEWTIPKEAKLGTYSVSLLAERIDQVKTRTRVGGYQAGDEAYFPPRGRHTGSFRVEEYRVPLMKGSIQALGLPLVRPKSAELDLMLSYLSGGGAGLAPVVLRTAVQPKGVFLPDHDQFLIANGKVREGITRGGRPEYRYGDEEMEEAGAEEEGEERPQPAGVKDAVTTRELLLDEAGAKRVKVDHLPELSAPHDLVAELEYRDPNGAAQTASSRVPLWPSKLLVGIKPDSWAAAKEDFRFHAVVLDLSGKPVAGVPVSVDLLERKEYSHRKRLVGGFYSYEHVTEVRRVADSFCTGTTDSKGLLICEKKSPVSGNLILQARALDPDGFESAANRDVWIAGKEEWWFDVGDSDRIDLLPESKRYEPGETARFQVRMPFREATALVTVEREGIVETFLRTLSGKAPVVEIPVKPYYAPNVFVSVLCVRGRVAGTAPTAMVDLGRPAFKLGIAEIRVGWRAHELKVSVAPEKEVYKVREKARVAIRAKRADGGALPKGSEVALAAVDEGLLELSPNGSWQLLQAMMGRRPYEVRTATAQMQVVGKRHFGLKALPSGGGGGKQATRELFDTLLLWKARVALDNNGEATVEIPLNDSLTSFRIVAVASGGAEFFGTGEASVRSSQDLMILSGLPPLVREDDRFRANFTVRNGTDRPMEVDLTGTATPGGARPPIRVALAPGEAREAGWDLRVPSGTESLSWEVAAAAEGAGASDRIRVRQKVVPAVPVRTFQATITQLKGSAAVPVERPGDALPGKGGVTVSLRARLSEGLGGVTYYMSRYPYTCLEQRVSRAVALRDKALWKSVVDALPAHLDGDGLAKFFPAMRLGDDSLTAYILSIADEAGYAIPSDLKERMETGLAGFIEGRVIRYGALPTADLSIRKMAALEALSRSGKATAARLGSIALEPNLWPTSAVIDWLNVLQRTKDLPDREKRAKEAEQIIRARLNFQGTTMGFSTERTDYLWWLMASGDVNAAKVVLAFLSLPGSEEDMPRLVNGAISRQYRGAWNTTVANAWGVLAVEKFSAKFESVPVTGSTEGVLGETTREVDWASSPGGGAVSFGWPQGQASLALSHHGTGRPWATIQSLAAIPLKEPFSSGYRILKTVSPVRQKEKGKWSRGDVARVSLSVEAQSDMTWVVLSDPVPGGSSILGTGLGGDSQLLTRGEKYHEGLVWPSFEERSFEAYRSYYEFVPKGKWTVEYTVRLNNGGTFLLPSTRVEALYAPEMFGEIPNKAWEVLP